MKLAIVRGEFLNKWEMQNYEPLTRRMDIVAFGSRWSPVPLNNVQMPMERLLCVDPYINRFRPLRVSVGFALGRYVGRQLLLGLEDSLQSFDVVHTAETYFGFTYQAARAKCPYNYKLVTTCWETIPFSHAEEPPMRRQKRYVQRQANLFLAMSMKAAEALRLEGIDDRRIRVHYPGINLDHFRPLPRTAQDSYAPWRKDGALRVLLVGSIVHTKGIREFVLAAAEIARMPAFAGQVEFALVGNGPDAPLVDRMVTQLGLQDVVIHGSGLPYANMPNLYASADIFVLPSLPTPQWEEQFGLVLAESMACGKSVVATTAGAIPEVVGDAAVLVPAYDYHALADAIAGLLRDDTARHRLGERAVARARALFDAHQFAEDVYKMYQEL